MPWSIREAVDVIKWIIEEHGGNDDAQAYRQICSYINESEKPTTNKQSESCAHEWILIQGNPVVTGMDICVKCHSLKAHDTHL